jgi:hypothetical protein
MTTRFVHCAPRRALFITRIEVKKSVIYDRKATVIGRVGKPDFLPKIELNDASVRLRAICDGERLIVNQMIQ